MPGLSSSVPATVMLFQMMVWLSPLLLMPKLSFWATTEGTFSSSAGRSWKAGLLCTKASLSSADSVIAELLSALQGLVGVPEALRVAYEYHTGNRADRTRRRSEHRYRRSRPCDQSAAW